MVFFFQTCNNKYIIYMGRDKFENEELLQHGLEVDVWFHVSQLSSAHVYLRLPDGVDLESIPEDVLIDCCQLVKQNSIEGCKKDNVKIVYTMFGNLKKTKSMEIGQVGFHDHNACHYYTVETRDRAIVNRVSKSRVEKDMDVLLKLRDKWLKKQRKKKRAAKQRAAEELARKKEEWKREKERRSYERVMVEEEMTSNKDLEDVDVEEYEDDFM